MLSSVGKAIVMLKDNTGAIINILVTHHFRLQLRQTSNPAAD
jgi:hypothetical protein